MAIAKKEALEIWEMFYAKNGNKHKAKTKQMCYDLIDKNISEIKNGYEIRHLRSVKQEIEKF